MKRLCQAGIRHLCLGVAALLVCGLFPSSAHAWWDVDWNSRITITFDNSAQTGNLINVPVLVVLNNTRIDYGKTENND